MPVGSGELVREGIQAMAGVPKVPAFTGGLDLREGLWS